MLVKELLQILGISHLRNCWQVTQNLRNHKHQDRFRGNAVVKLYLTAAIKPHDICVNAFKSAAGAVGVAHALQ